MENDKNREIARKKKPIPQQGQPPIKKKKRKRKKKKSFLKKLILLIRKLIPIVIIIGILMYCYPIFFNKTLFDKWESTESGQILRFYEDGRVKIKGNDIDAFFEIKGDNHMLYTIEGKTFDMYYRFDDDNLYWGTDINNLEIFDRK